MTNQLASYIAASELYFQGQWKTAGLPELAALAGHRVCVVGSTGQIGSALISVLHTANIRQFSASPIQIYGIARHASAMPASCAPLDVQFLEASVEDADAVQTLPDFDYVIYVAGTASDYLRRRQETIATQVVGLEAFLTRYSGCKGFAYISTRVYGRVSDGLPITEAAFASVPPMHLDNIYDSAKRLGESLCLWHARSSHTPAVVARLSNVYGAHFWRRIDTAISDFALQAAQTGTILLKGNPNSTRNWTCSVDIAQGVLRTLLLGRPGEAYNIGSEEHLTSHQLAEMVAAALPVPVSVQVPSQPAPLSLQTISIERAKRELAYCPTFTFASVAPLVVADTLRNNVDILRNSL